MTQVDFRNDVNWNQWILLWNDHLSQMNRWQQPISTTTMTLDNRYERVPEGSHRVRQEVGYVGSSHLDMRRIDQDRHQYGVDPRAHLTRAVATPAWTGERIQVSSARDEDEHRISLIT